ncbi:MAG: hypothetical protein IJU87_00335 [Lachnospiraceae bacterium]|nr:hypothetical protein [Lachnospiraceae bacterium]
MVKKAAVILMITALLFTVTSCGKTGKDSIAENDNLTRILGTGAAGMGGSRGDAGVADLPDVNTANMRSTPGEGVDYFKLVEGTTTALDAGDYTVGMADNMCSVTVMDADGNVVDSVSIAAQGDGGNTPLKGAATISVPEGGTAISVGGTCIAQKHGAKK